MSQISITLTPTLEVDAPEAMDQPTIVLLLPYLAAAGPGGGVTDHGALTGLADDDHSQYLNNARGDARYQPLDSDLTAIAALSTTAYGRALLALADAAAGRTALGLGTAATQASWAFDAAGAAAAAQAASQPLDSDLTAIAALSTTSYGRALLALADAAAGRTALGIASTSTTAEGLIELATQGEVDAGSDAVRAVTAATLAATPKLARDLGVFTWAALQAAYPNGGAALLALPAGSFAWISDWGVPFYPALSNTAWRTAAPLTLLSITADTTAILNSTTNFQAAVTWTPPLKLLIPGAALEIAYRAKQASGTAKPRAQCQISGVSAALAQTSGSFGAAYTRGRWRADVRVAEVLRFNSGGNAERDQNRSEGSSLVLDTATAFSGSNSLEIGFSTWSTTVSDSTFVFEQLAIVLHPPA